MFQNHKQYRHDSCLDIDIIVQEVFTEDTDSSIIFVGYWNRHYRCYQGKCEVVQVKNKDYHLWKEVSVA